MTDTKPVVNPFTPLSAPTFQPFQNYLPTSFSDELTLLQKVNMLLAYMQTVTGSFNDIGTTWSDVVDWVTGTGLSDDVSSQLTTWLNDGTLDSIVNNNVFPALNNKISDLAISLRDYNVVGDGVTDDTVNFNNALNALSSGGRLLINEPVFITQDITIPDNVEIIFSDKGKINIGGGFGGLKLGNNCSLYNAQIYETRAYSAIPNQSAGVTVSGKTNVKILGGIISKFTFTNISITSSTHVLINGVEASSAGTKDDGNGGWDGQGIYVTQNSQYITLVNNDVHDNGKHGIQSWSDGTSYSSKNIIISNNHSYNNGDTGISVNHLTFFNVSGNVCNGNGNNGGPYGGQGVQVVGGNDSYTTSYGLVDGNITDSNLENGIQITQYSTQINVSNNISRNNTWHGITVDSNCSDIQISGNVSNQNHNNGILTNSASSINITGNVTNKNNYSGHEIDSSTDVQVTGFVSNNNGQTTANKGGVIVSGGSRVGVSDGQAMDNQGTATQTFGVRFYNVTGGEIRGVRGSGNITNLIQYDNGSTSIVTDNPSDSGTQYGGRTDKNGVRFLSGAGDPSNRITAPIGSVYLRTDGGASTSLYVKESGTGNTGWIAK